MPVAVIDEGDTAPETESPRSRPGLAPAAGLIEIDLGDGRKVRVDKTVDGAALRRVLAVLSGR
jgi:transposase